MSEDINHGQDNEDANAAQPKSSKAPKKGKGNFIVSAVSNIDANTILNILVAPLILTTRFFSSISDGSTTVKDIYKLALQHSFIGLVIAVVFEKPHAALAAAAGSLIFIIINYFVNPSIEHADALTDTFKSFRRYSAVTLMVRFANLIPLIKINGDFENDFRLDGKKQRQIVNRPARVADNDIEISISVSDDEIDYGDMIDDSDIYDGTDDLGEKADVDGGGGQGVEVLDVPIMPPSIPQVNLPPLQNMNSLMPQGVPAPVVPAGINLPSPGAGTPLPPKVPIPPSSPTMGQNPPMPQQFSTVPQPPTAPRPAASEPQQPTPSQPVMNTPQQPIPQQDNKNIRDEPIPESINITGIHFGTNNRKTAPTNPNQIVVDDDFE